MKRIPQPRNEPGYGGRLITEHRIHKGPFPGPIDLIVPAVRHEQ
jgi:hypothetical protein